MLEIKDLVKKYPGGRTAVSHFSLNIREGEIIAVLGGKGAGKTSLLKTLAGAEEKTSGKVLL
ncbi:MAG TPA: ATP-binding cassette domain-containing protein, partial [Clostridia bacterium]|nr:ATP-binding cassette domain-containing protein [Clostridia bacterium]